MSTEKLTAEAMSLPLVERVSLAQALWASIDGDRAGADNEAAIREAVRRSEELTSGAVVGRTHTEVMQAVRRAVECA